MPLPFKILGIQSFSLIMIITSSENMISLMTASEPKIIFT